jgi:hypothetical protein
MSRCREGRFRRLLRFLRPEQERRCGDWWADEQPPDAFVREPRGPKPSSPSGTVTLDLPEIDA